MESDEKMGRFFHYLGQKSEKLDTRAIAKRRNMDYICSEVVGVRGC